MRSRKENKEELGRELPTELSDLAMISRGRGASHINRVCPRDEAFLYSQ